MSYAPHVATWAQRGRALTSELVGGNREKLSGGRVRADRAARDRAAARRARSGDDAHRLGLLRRRAAAGAAQGGARGSPCRCRATRRCGRRSAQIPESAWTDALDMPGAQVAETTYTPGRLASRAAATDRPPRRRSAPQKIADGSLTARRRKTIHPDQLALALDGQVASVFGYSFILTDIPHQPTVWVEHFHRHRAQIEERLKDAKLGQALRHLPSGDEQRQPRLADLPRCWRSTSPPGAATCAPPPAPRARRPTTRRCAEPPRRCAGSSSTSPPASSAAPGARSCACPKASATPTSSRPPWTPSTRCRHPEPRASAADVDAPRDRRARRPRKPARSTATTTRPPPPTAIHHPDHGRSPRRRPHQHRHSTTPAAYSLK